MKQWFILAIFVIISRLIWFYQFSTADKKLISFIERDSEASITKILLGKKLFQLNVLTQIYPSQMVMAAAQLNTIIISGVFSLKMFECKVGNTRKKVLRFHPLAKNKFFYKASIEYLF